MHTGIRWFVAVVVVCFGLVMTSWPAGAQETAISDSSGPSATEDATTCDGLEPTIIGAGRIRGTSGDDVILGSDGPDTITGGSGDDVICGGDGDDTIRGGSGDDRIFGGKGGDVLYGDSGNDFLNIGPDADDNTVHGGVGNDTFDSQTGGRIDCEGIGSPEGFCETSNVYFGDAGDDTMGGGATFYGGPGNDLITGDGNLNGNSGNDVLLARGLAILDGGSGRDRCSGSEDFPDYVRRSCENTLA